MTLLRADIDAIHARRIVVDRLRRAAHDPAYHQRTGQGQRMEPVRTGLLAWNLPVARQHETLRRPKHLKAIVAAAEQLVEIESGVAQKRVKRMTIDIPGRENQPAIQMHPSLLQPKLILRALVPVHLLLLDRLPDAAAVRTKRTAITNAAMHLPIPRLPNPQPHT